MENHVSVEITEQDTFETPQLIKFISSHELDGFDTFHSQFPSPARKVRIAFFFQVLLLIVTQFFK